MTWLTNYLPTLLSGVSMTLTLTIAGGLFALVVSFAAGMLRLSRWMAVRGATRIYVEFFRGTSLLVQLFWFFFALPQLTGYRIEALYIGIITLGLSYGAYGSEVVRGSIQAVPKAQYEATTALNMRPALRMRKVILPQAIPLMLPSFGNLLIELLKGTALVYVITLVDVTQEARILRGANAGDSAVIFGLTLVIYFVLGMLFMRGMRLLERRASAGVGRPQPPLFGKVNWFGFGKRASRTGASQ